MTGEVFTFVSFVNRYPYVMWNILLFGLGSALGQVSSNRKSAAPLIEILLEPLED